MTLTPTQEHQTEMCHAYYDGAPGVVVSSLVWFSSAFVCWQFGIEKAVWTLLVGGALIHPLSLVLTKVLRRPAVTHKDNALNTLAITSTVWLIVCCAMSYGLYLLHPKLFYPAMMACIGSRFLIFASIYGKRFFILLGACLILAANAALFLQLPNAVAATVSGAIELGFAIVLFTASKK